MTRTPGSGADCIWTFGVKAVGNSYLFYVDKPSKTHPFSDEIELSKTAMYYPVTCGRSQQIVDYETDDLKYLNNVEKVKGKTRISGELDCWTSSCPSLSNVPITITGEKNTYQTKTDENGVYEIYDLPAGKYLVSPQIPKGWLLDPFMLRYSPAFRENDFQFYGKDLDFSKGVPLELEPGRHNGIDFFFNVDTAIRGKVLSPDGKPMMDVCVMAVSTDLKEGDYRGRSDCTNDEGIFVIKEAPPGQYILVANNDGQVTAKEPFGTLFYGNTFKFSEAKKFELKLGDHLDDLTIQAPKIAEVVMIRGKVLYKNDVPVAKEWITLRVYKSLEEVASLASVKTDVDGNFSLKILKNFKGKLFGEFYISDDDFKACPNAFKDAEKLIRKLRGDVTTSAVSIDATSDVSDLILRVDFAGCQGSLN